MTDLKTTYLGLELENPLIVSASPLTGDAETLRQAEAAGAAAVVLPSLFEEQIKLEGMRLSRYVPGQQEMLPGELRHVPDMDGYNQGMNGYIVHLYETKKALNIPVIASLNAYYGGGWSRYAKILESAGADALELNIYYLATQPQVSGAEVEDMYLDLVRDIMSYVDKIPVAVKLSPFFSSMANVAHRLDEIGVSGLVLFNRFYQPDFDIEQRTVTPSLQFSTPAELRLRLRWVAMLHRHIEADMVITGGVHSAEDVVKSIMAGARAVMMTSALMQHGIDYLGQVRTDLAAWLETHDYKSLQEIYARMCQEAVADPAAFERANYMHVISSYRKED